MALSLCGRGVGHRRVFAVDILGWWLVVGGFGRAASDWRLLAAGWQIGRESETYWYRSSGSFGIVVSCTELSFAVEHTIFRLED